MAATASAIKQQFPGVKVGDGFANTIPWPASSTEPAGVDAIDKHPYPNLLSYPSQVMSGTPLDALGNPDSSGWRPTYESHFPEYFDTALQTEFIIRDMSPINTPIGVTHGANGSNPPTPLWITEINQTPNSTAPGIDLATDEYLKAKVSLRLYSLNLNRRYKRSTCTTLRAATWATEN